MQSANDNPFVVGTGRDAIAFVEPSHAVRCVYRIKKNEADLSRAFSLGPQDFVHKPMDLDDYKTAISGMVQKKWTDHDSVDMESVPT